MHFRKLILWLVFMFLSTTIAPGLTRTPAARAAHPPLSAPQTACTPPLVQVPSTNRLGYNELDSLAAIKPTDLWAVGYYYTPTYGIDLPLIEHGDGTTWNVVPQAVTTTTVQLGAVAGTASNDVWAVGSSGRTYATTLTEHWDGSAWHLVPSPNPGGSLGYALLRGVAAIAPNNVWAVGYYWNPNTPSSGALIIHWDGVQWSQVAAPATGISTGLSGITAVSSTDIWAVGGAGGQYPSPLTLHWDGSAWQQVAVPNLPGGGQLAAVSARATDDVWAVGGVSGQYPSPLILHWDGSQWSRTAGPALPGQTIALLGVAALAPGDAWAVGSATPQQPYADQIAHPLVLHWDGAAWQVGTAPAVRSGSLRAVASAQASGPFVAGTQDTPSSLLARWNGSTWQIAASANPGWAGNRLFGVGASGPRDIWTVGLSEVYPGGTGAYILTSLVEHWDGQAWSTVLTPHSSPVVTLENTLASVAALTPADAWAVGSVDDGSGGNGILIDHWNGAAWTTVVSGNPEAQPMELRSVAAVSANDVWAVGVQSSTPGATDHTLIEHWNGATWSMVPSPNSGSGFNVLQSVAVVAANDIWAAGYASSSAGPGPQIGPAHPGAAGRAGAAPASGTMQPLLLHWNGLSWTVAPAPAGVTGALFGLAAAGPHDVWAVGTVYNQTNINTQTLTLHWDGTAWHPVSSPNPSTNTNTLFGVAVAAANDVWATGYSAIGPFSRSLLLHWDGSAWSSVPSASPGVIENGFFGLVATAAHDVWAVGTYSNGAPAQTLIAHAGLFADVQPADYYYAAVNYLVDRAAVAGYADCTFKPGLPAARAVLTKMVVVANGWTLITPAQPHFSDVPRTDPFYAYVETAYAHGIVSGYADGKFHPTDPVTRGQASKIVVLARGWALLSPATAHFGDVPRGSTFYAYVETAYAHGILSGYGDGTFRPATPITRGQAGKIVYLAVVGPGG